MSTGAINWAKQQKTSGPSAKCVLLVLADYAGANGACWPTEKRIADETDQSIDSVQRRLRELARAGLIYRADIGRRKKNGWRGASQSVVMHDEEARAYAVSLGWQEGSYEPGDSGDLSEEDAAAEADVVSVPQPQSAAVADEPQPHGCGVGQHRTVAAIEPLDSEPPYSPKSPFSEKPLAPKIEAEPSFAAFEKLWPWPPGALREPSRRAWQRLPPAEKLLAIRDVETYLALRRKTGRKIGDARPYLRDKGWEAAAAAANAVMPQVWVRKGSLEWNAWAGVRGKRWPDGRVTMFAYDSRQHPGQSGAYFPSLWPPKATSPPQLEDAAF